MKGMRSSSVGFIASQSDESYESDESCQIDESDESDEMLIGLTLDVSPLPLEPLPVTFDP